MHQYGYRKVEYKNSYTNNKLILFSLRHGSMLFGKT